VTYLGRRNAFRAAKQLGLKVRHQIGNLRAQRRLGDKKSRGMKLAAREDMKARRAGLGRYEKVVAQATALKCVDAIGH
jgi:hypothetical protein